MTTLVGPIEQGTVRQYTDLRDYIAIVDALGELRQADGADPYLEIGAICALGRESEMTPAVLCDRILGQEPGFRILLNPHSSLNRSALMDRLPLGLKRAEYNKLGPAKFRSMTPIPPREVNDGPVLQNIQEGDSIDLTRFPRPVWNFDDGGAYIGTGDAVITRDPGSGWINVGAYRVMYQDPTHVSLYINPDNHGRMHRDKYFRQGKPCPVLMSLGHDPLLFAVGAHHLQAGLCEYDFMGGIRGEPVDVIVEPHTGLPMPAHSEIVIAGEIRPDDIRPEGPFGEVFGYYASGVQDRPAVEVKAVYFRNAPIILGNPPPRPPRQVGGGGGLGLLFGEGLSQRLRGAVPGVKDAYSHMLALGHLQAVSIEQQYPGHAMQAGLALVNGPGHRPRYAIVVDDDVNVRDLQELLWAVCTRTDPIKDIHIVPKTTAADVEPIIPTWENNIMSRCIIDATRPWEWREQFPKTVNISAELRQHTLEKWAEAIV